MLTSDMRIRPVVLSYVLLGLAFSASGSSDWLDEYKIADKENKIRLVLYNKIFMKILKTWSSQVYDILDTPNMK